MALEAGTRLDHYEVVSSLGVGGMGEGERGADRVTRGWRPGEDAMPLQARFAEGSMGHKEGRDPPGSEAVTSSTPRDFHRHLGIIAVVLILAALAWMAAATGMNLVTSHRARNWPSVQGRILSMEAEGDGYSGWSVDLEYEYDVDVSTYHSRRRYRWFGTDRFANRKTESLRENYPAITVYYDPSEPSVSSLDRGIRWQHYSYEPIAGCFMYVFDMAVIALVFAVAALIFYPFRKLYLYWRG